MSREIEIIKGHDDGSCFWIMPINNDINSELLAEEISIEEEYVWHFLSCFLIKYYDKNLKQNTDRKWCSNEFEWNLEHNCYTYSAIRTMLDDIRKVIKLLQTDYDNPYLAPFKERFCILYMLECNSPLHDKAMRVTDAERNKMVRDNIQVVIDFYERFIVFMENILENAKDYNLISFMGP